jgi:glucosamine--fructose-6-phosphate aminotransferase (isomerizing)
MCGIFGIYSADNIYLKEFKKLALLSERRGRDSSGLLYFQNEGYKVSRADFRIRHLLSDLKSMHTPFMIGHSRLITNGKADNQPIVRDGIVLIHNGIIVDDEKFWETSSFERLQQIDSEVIIALALAHLEESAPLEELYIRIQENCTGSFSCALLIPHLGKMVMLSNTGSLYLGSKGGCSYFASERQFLDSLNVDKITQLFGSKVIDVPVSNAEIDVLDYKVDRDDLIPKLSKASLEEKKLIFPEPNLRRCTKCILPETMPFIKFDSKGECNYCKSYVKKNESKPKADLEEILQRYQSTSGDKVIVPFSGGRDSTYTLHLIKQEFGMQPITMTYDWGMVTDLARRNISRMCSSLGVENILIADDIEKKRRNVKLNLVAWLRKPELGMINILMAGDKHFFRHIQTVKMETNISLNIWGMNPLEVTHFKAGFLGFPPDFAMDQVFNTGLHGQMRYQALRAKEVFKNPSYINRSLWDTLSGEYYRSVKKQTDFYNLFDYWLWDETEIDRTLDSYEWERSVDTKSTWRIGDGTAAFYNYVYYTMAGFTEYDTFRSNQIREGQLSRDKALELVADENRPRYQNIKWYLDTLGLDFNDVISLVNNSPRVY